MRLKVWVYLQGEYLYLLVVHVLTMRCKTYTIAKQKILPVKFGQDC